MIVHRESVGGWSGRGFLLSIFLLGVGIGANVEADAGGPLPGTLREWEGMQGLSSEAKECVLLDRIIALIREATPPCQLPKEYWPESERKDPNRDNCSACWGNLGFWMKCLIEVASERSRPFLEELLNRPRRQGLPQPPVGAQGRLYVPDGELLDENATRCWWRIVAEGKPIDERVKYACYGFHPDSPVLLSPQVCAIKLSELGVDARTELYETLTQPGRDFNDMSDDSGGAGFLRCILAEPAFQPQDHEVDEVLRNGGPLPMTAMVLYLIEQVDRRGIGPAVRILNEGHWSAVTLVYLAIVARPECGQPGSPWSELADALVSLARGDIANPQISDDGHLSLRGRIVQAFSGSSWRSKVAGYPPALDYMEEFLQSIDPDDPLREVRGRSGYFVGCYARMIANARKALEKYRGVEFDWDFDPQAAAQEFHSRQK